MSTTTDLSAAVASVLDQISPTPEFYVTLSPVVTVILRTLTTMAATSHNKTSQLERLREIERKVVEAHPQVPPNLIRMAIVVGSEHASGPEDPDPPLLGARVHHRPTPSPLTSALLARAALADQVEDALIAWLDAAPDRPNTAATHAGVALLLIILRGGLTEWTSLRSLLDKPIALWLSDGLGESLESTDEVPWLSLPPLAKLTLASFVTRYPGILTLGDALRGKATQTPQADDTQAAEGAETTEDSQGVEDVADREDVEDIEDDGDGGEIAQTEGITRATTSKQTTPMTQTPTAPTLRPTPSVPPKPPRPRKPKP